MEKAATSRNIAARHANDRAGRNDGRMEFLQPLVTLGVSGEILTGSGFIAAGSFPGPEVPFPLTRADLARLSAEQLDALETFYGTRFGRNTNSATYRRAEFAAFVGDTQSWGELKRLALAQAQISGIDVAKDPHRL